MTHTVVAASIACLATGITLACRYLLYDHCASCDAALTDPDDEAAICWRCSRQKRYLEMISL